MNHLQFQTPVGAVGITWNSQGSLIRVDWYDTIAVNGRSLNQRLSGDSFFPKNIQRILAQMERYFHHGEPMEDLDWGSIERRGWSEFQSKVYQAVARIPHGETRTYSWVAERVGAPRATRAVGQALRRNPLPLVVPCHRVVTTTALGGFMGARNPDDPEIKLKSRLIQLEEQYCSPVFSFLSSSEETAWSNSA